MLCKPCFITSGLINIYDKAPCKDVIPTRSLALYYSDVILRFSFSKLCSVWLKQGRKGMKLP